MTKQFYYEDLNCLALQRAIKTCGAFEVVLYGQQAHAFEKIAQSLAVGQEIDREPFANFKNQKRLGVVLIRLIRNLALAWKTLFSFHRFAEFKTFGI